MGRSYGDVCLNEGGRLIVTDRLDRIMAFDRERGVLRAEAGLTLDRLLRVTVPHGWFAPVVPGTKFVTSAARSRTTCTARTMSMSGRSGRT
jgi:FAD/FMN-containing dehydrogenase